LKIDQDSSYGQPRKLDGDELSNHYLKAVGWNILAEQNNSRWKSPV
jgi:hypothetical protein